MLGPLTPAHRLDSYDVINSGLSTPTGIALDIGGGKVYLIDSGNDFIRVS